MTTSDALTPPGPRPSVDANSHTDRLAMNAVERLFLEHGSVQLEVPSRDFGRDGRLIFRFDDGGAAGYSTSLQVKGTASAKTEGMKAFIWRVPRQNVVYLSDCQAPAYYVFHNCATGKTYVREVHDLCSYLDASQPEWRSDSSEDVSVLVQVEISRLGGDKVRHIAEEARAWAMERQTTKKLVKYLEAEYAKIGAIKVESAFPGSKKWRLVGGGFRLKSGANLSTRDAITAFLFGAYVSHGRYLCDLYWTRQHEAMMPHELIRTSRGGILDLTTTTRQLLAAAEDHRVWLANAEHLEWMPADESHGTGPAVPAHPPLMLPDLEQLSADAAAKEIEQYLITVGLEVARSSEQPLDLIVRCGKATGLLSLAVFGDRATRARIESVRTRLEAVGASAGAVLLKFSQSDELKLHLWEEPAEPKKPPIPLGTDAPILDGFLASLLGHCSEQGGWHGLPTSAADLLPPANGYAGAMPTGMAPDSEAAQAYQQAIVQRHAVAALGSVKDYRPIYFLFHWGLRRIEVYGLTSPADLAIFTLRGPRAFDDSGGHTMKSHNSTSEPE